jgi:hypothetical protein
MLFEKGLSFCGIQKLDLCKKSAGAVRSAGIVNISRYRACACTSISASERESIAIEHSIRDETLARALCTKKSNPNRWAAKDISDFVGIPNQVL